MIGLDAGKIPVDLDARTLPPGTMLRRWYKGRCHVVRIELPLTITPEAEAKGWWRYVYMGRYYKTLSAIAREITGEYRMSGNRFFGLRKRRRGKCKKATAIR